MGPGMDPAEYELDFFRTKGFVRAKCPRCERHYWSVGQPGACGDATCVEYSFLGHSPLRERLTLREMREAFLSFLEDSGHTRVARYPITARWRDDVFFTQASIYGFQPWVIQGVVEPPANPLAISQTCLRFNDISNVGRTGAHLTMFEMMAHHVFNTAERKVYWKDQTVELCHEFLTGRLGADPAAITYVEEWWEGGGNSGPCLEVCLGGLELATLVFMVYREENGKRTPMPMQVVDTGYGLERLTWLAQGSSSAYEAVFGDVLERLKREAGVSAEPRLLAESSRVAGQMRLRTTADLRSLREAVARRLESTVEELEAAVVPFEHLYVLCDHSRALMFMLNDGVVPSNVRQGYFARLLVRRALRARGALRLVVPLADVVDLQVDYFRKDFPELEENRVDLRKLIEIEESRYLETVGRGRGIVQRLEEELRKAGKAIGPAELVELYDSHGLNPELVSEFASHAVHIPDDFYGQVAAKHARPVAEEMPAELVLPKPFPPTKLAFYDDSRKERFRAKVLGSWERHLVLDKTYFYPESGGAECDLGTIAGIPLEKVGFVGHTVVHTLSAPLPKPSKVVTGAVDMERRRAIVRHHSATHIINGIARQILGNHVWQAGAHKSPTSGRLDLTHYADLSDEELRKIERLANEAVLENVQVTARLMDRTTAEKRFGFRLYQGGAVPGKLIRVLQYGRWDVEACGGIHVKRTLEIGPIRLLGSRRIQDGIVRLEYTAGLPTIDLIQQEGALLAKASAAARTSPAALPAAVERLQAEVRELRKSLERERKVRSSLRGDELIAAARAGDRIVGPIELEDLAAATALSRQVAAAGLGFVGSGNEGELPRLLVAWGGESPVDCGAIVKEVVAAIGGSGGGRRDFAMGGGFEPARLAEGLSLARAKLAQAISASQ